MKLLGSTKNKINRDKNDENVPKLGVTKVVLIHCNIVKNDYFVSNTSFGKLLDNSPKNSIFLKTFNS